MEAGGAQPPAAGGQGNVTGIQKLLQKLGYDPGKIDGIMGPHTKEAIKKFQQANGLAADGMAGPKTQAAMAKALKGGSAAEGGASASGAAGASALRAGAQPTRPGGSPLGSPPSMVHPRTRPRKIMVPGRAPGRTRSTI